MYHESREKGSDKSEEPLNTTEQVKSGVCRIKKWPHKRVVHRIMQVKKKESSTE